ncbi:MAG: ECF transporter S component [Clostridia bacterium]|nr:ECF transporter S component [Clostridia bacterium]
MLKSLLMSNYLWKKRPAYVIATMAMLMALSVVVNAVEAFKFADLQFSLTIAIMAFIGLAAGPVSGFLIGFFGDLLGFFINSGGYAYYPWVGISTGLFALVAGLVSMKKSEKVYVSYIKIAIFAVVTFVICTLFINTLFYYLAFYKGTLNFFDYMIMRVFGKLQFVNSLVNYALVFIGYTVLRNVKPLAFLFE